MCVGHTGDLYKLHSIFYDNVDICYGVAWMVRYIIFHVTPYKYLVGHNVDIVLLKVGKELGNCDSDAIGAAVSDVC